METQPATIKKCPKCGFRYNRLYIRQANKMIPAGYLCKICKTYEITYPEI